MPRSNPPTPPKAKIDWYSFTLPLAGPLSGAGEDSLEAINHALRTVFPAVIDAVSNDGTWSVEQAKGFYNFRATHRASRLAVSWGTVNAHVFVELAGQSCDWFRLSGLFASIVGASYLRVSRIDCAIDISRSTSPAEFVAAGYAERFSTTVGAMDSSTGQTRYVGARKSDRFARVYRYAPPHPRSHLLRVEVEYKGKAAKELAKVLMADGEVAAVRAAHAAFAWKHSDLDDGFLEFPISNPDPPTGPDMGNTAGSTPVFDRLYSDTMRRDLLTWFAGLRRKSSRRLYHDRQLSFW